MTGRQVLETTLSAATRLGSAHYVLRTTTPSGRAELITGDASSKEGAQYIVSGQDQTVVQLIGTTLFVKGNSAGLQDLAGLSGAQASQQAGRWLAVPAGDPLYGRFASSLLLPHVLADFTPTGTLGVSTPGTVHGHRVVGVRGALGTGPGSGTAVLWASTSSPSVPVGGETDRGGGVAEASVAAFSSWGERVALQGPSGAVAYSSPPS